MRVVLVFVRSATGSTMEIETYREDLPVFVEGFNGFEISLMTAYPEDK